MLGSLLGMVSELETGRGSVLDAHLKHAVGYRVDAPEGTSGSSKGYRMSGGHLSRWSWSSPMVQPCASSRYGESPPFSRSSKASSFGRDKVLPFPLRALHLGVWPPDGSRRFRDHRFRLLRRLRHHRDRCRRTTPQHSQSARARDGRRSGSISWLVGRQRKRTHASRDNHEAPARCERLWTGSSRQTFDNRWPSARRRVEVTGHRGDNRCGCACTEMGSATDGPHASHGRRWQER